MSVREYTRQLNDIQIQKKRVLDEILNIENALKSIDEKMKVLEHNKIAGQMNKMTDMNLKKEYNKKLLSKLQRRRIENMKLRENELKNKPVQCSGMNIIGDHLERCTNISNKKYCEQHENRYRYEKPDCPICMDEISEETEIPLMCGHWIHKTCLIPTNIHICPVCRQKMQQDEVNYVFGEQHQERNIYVNYMHNYVLPYNYSAGFNPLQVRDPSQMYDQFSEEDTLLLYTQNNPFERETAHSVLELLRRIMIHVNTNNYSYFINQPDYSRRRWMVPSVLLNRVKLFRDELIHRCFFRSAYNVNVNRIDEYIQTLPGDQRSFINNLFILLFNISLNQEIYLNHFVRNEIVNLVKTTIIKLGLYDV